MAFKSANTLRFPAKQRKIKSRKSTLTNTFTNAIIPIIKPTEEEKKTVLALLGMEENAMICVYCGAKAQQWDHFRPLVKANRPTGYITEISNLVPACGDCNASKGNKDWRQWLDSNVKKSPKSRGIDTTEIKQRLESFEKNTADKITNITQIIEPEWNHYISNLNKILELIEDSQKHADAINDKIAQFLKSENR